MASVDDTVDRAAATMDVDAALDMAPVTDVAQKRRRTTAVKKRPSVVDQTVVVVKRPSARSADRCWASEASHT